MLNQLNKFITIFKAGYHLWCLRNKYLPKGHKSAHGPFYVGSNIHAYLSYVLFTYFNPVHYGLWIKEFPKKTNSLVDLEIDVFKSMIKTFGGNLSNWTGFINGGSSAGNFYALLLCREWFLSQGYKKITLFHTRLTHHSIISSAKILGLKLEQVELSDQWIMDINKLEDKLLSLESNEAGCIFLTWGYKQTGTLDQLSAVQNIIDKLKINKQVGTCLDAAFDGLVVPFSPKPIKPLCLSSLFAMTFDFHKYLGVPAPAGGILFKKKLLPKDRFVNEGLSETKSLLPAIAVWSSLVGKKQMSKLKKQVERAQILRKYFIDQYKIFCDGKFFYHQSNISLLFSCNLKHFVKLRYISDQYPLRYFKEGDTYWIKILFLPQLGISNIKKLVKLLIIIGCLLLTILLPPINL